MANPSRGGDAKLEVSLHPRQLGRQPLRDPAPLGNIGLYQLGVITGSSWTPSIRFPVLASLLSTLPGASTSVAFRFTPQGNATWSIDDVYVDPISRR